MVNPTLRSERRRTVPRHNSHHSRHYFDLKGKDAEQFLHELAVKTFLTDWCFLNPILPNGKELCDLLVVFDQTAIIWQVKDLKLGRDGKYKTSEVMKNIRQLSGARRQLFELRTPIQLRNPRRTVEKLDPADITEVFLISVLLGEGEDYFTLVESVNQFTAHIFDGDFTLTVLTELDTVADFTNYLRAKERLLKENQVLIIEGGEKELLAFYLFNERSFERLQESSAVRIDETWWDKLVRSQSYRLKKKEDQISYVWDELINRAHEGSKKYEIVARELARPTRFERRTLAKTMFDDHLAAHRDKANDIYRSMFCTSTVTYCYLFCARHIPRKGRTDMLEAMCYVARGTFRENQKVIAIATEKELSPTSSYDFAVLNLSSWTSEDENKVQELKKQLGMFRNPTRRMITEREYPDVVDDLGAEKT